MHSFKEIDSYISAQIEQQYVPGTVILIAKDGQVLHEKAYGYAQQFEIARTNEKACPYLEKMSTDKRLLTPPKLMSH